VNVQSKFKRSEVDGIYRDVEDVLYIQLLVSSCYNILLYPVTLYCVINKDNISVSVNIKTNTG
jgi:hypothetical protein